jgi:hypothetical protein
VGAESMKSVLQTEKECFVCGTTFNLHDHHIFFGTSNRKQSEKYGMKVWLCQEHHTGSAGVHFNKDLDMHLKKFAQTHFEANLGARTAFRSIFGKSYL